MKIITEYIHIPKLIIAVGLIARAWIIPDLVAQSILAGFGALIAVMAYKK